MAISKRVKAGQAKYIVTEDDSTNEVSVILWARKVHGTMEYLQELGVSVSDIDKIIEWTVRIIEARGE